MELKGKKNIYNCKTCGNTIVTQNREDGVTPMFLFCGHHGGCEAGSMVSMMYNVPQEPGILVASHEWYRPDDKELETLSDGSKEHVKNGGLLLRKKEVVAPFDPLKAHKEAWQKDVDNLEKNKSNGKTDS